LQERINRIIEQITDKKDKKWLSKKLKNAHEPSLADRIFETISSAPLGLDAQRLRKLSEECAKLRNDISHFGGQRQDSGSYSEFLAELSDKADALAIIYQTLLLHEIGIQEQTLRWWVFEGFRSNFMKEQLTRAGLLDTSTVNSNTSEVNL